MDVDELYGLPLERFVTERTALARELRAAGRRDEAGVVAAMRKPSVAARAVNQLVREDTPRLHELFAAGDALSEMQANVLGGRADGRALGEAAERERAVVAALVDEAHQLLDAEGLTASATVLERVGDTLHAAALDPDARTMVDAGRLERELRHVGLGMGAGEMSLPPATPDKPDKPGKPGTPATSKRAEQAAARRRAKALEQATATEAQTRREAQRTAKAVSTAERRRARAADAVTRAREALSAAEQALSAAREAAGAADQAHDEAERELRGLEG